MIEEEVAEYLAKFIDLKEKEDEEQALCKHHKSYSTWKKAQVTTIKFT